MLGWSKRRATSHPPPSPKEGHLGEAVTRRTDPRVAGRRGPEPSGDLFLFHAGHPAGSIPPRQRGSWEDREEQEHPHVWRMVNAASL